MAPAPAWRRLRTLRCLDLRVVSLRKHSLFRRLGTPYWSALSDGFAQRNPPFTDGKQAGTPEPVIGLPFDFRWVAAMPRIIACRGKSGNTATFVTPTVRISGAKLSHDQQRAMSREWKRASAARRGNSPNQEFQKP
jgi:hypothetical protein